MSNKNNSNLKKFLGESESKLEYEPSLEKYIKKAQSRFPLPPNYIPLDIEIKFDGLVHYRSELGEVVIANEKKDNPSYMEWLFDGECVLYQIGQEIVVDRLVNIFPIAELNQYLS